MSANFQEKKLRVSIMLNEKTPDRADKEKKTIVLEGYRTNVMVQNDVFTSQSKANVTIFGIREDIMQSLHKLQGIMPDKIYPNAIKIEAAQGNEEYVSVFEGQIYNSTPNYNASPNVSVSFEASPCAWWQFKLAKPNSWKGEVDVASMIEGLSKSINFSFKNNGVKEKLTNHYETGSAVGQIRNIARAAGIAYSIDKQTVTIWPNGEAAATGVIKLSPKTGLVGYPELKENSMCVATCLFNPELYLGRKVELETSIAPLAGTYFVHSTNHSLDAYTPSGKWFTEARLFRTALYIPKN